MDKVELRTRGIEHGQRTDGRVPRDEAASCYKPTAEVVCAVVEAGRAEIERRLWPLASLKGADERKLRQKRKTAKQSSAHY